MKNTTQSVTYKSARSIAFLSLTLALLCIASAFGQQAAAHVGPGGTSERWDVLPLSGSTLHPIPPELGERDTLPTFTRELLRVEWRFGDPIDLYVIRPVGIAKPPVVLYLYGYPTDTDRFRNDKLCATLTRNGFAAVGFVSALTGQRYHDRPMKEWFISELQESLGTSVHDVQMVLKYLATRGDLDMDRVGIFGQGSGGTIAILSAAVDPRIKAVDAIDPWGDWPDWLAKSPQVPDAERERYLTPAFLGSVAPLDPMRWMASLSTRPFRLEETLFSGITPELARNRLVLALPAHAIHVQYKTSEDYVRDASTGGRIIDWLQGQLTSVKP
jgi:hypothetical protein